MNSWERMRENLEIERQQDPDSLSRQEELQHAREMRADEAFSEED